MGPSRAVSAERAVALERAPEFLGISVIIPAYRGDGRLVELVRRVLDDPYPYKEVVVIVDEPVAEVAQRLAELRGCRLLLGPTRMGKVAALNTALKRTSGDVLVFLDDDTLIEDSEFLAKVARAMRDYDLADIKKVIVGESLLAKLVYVEYVAVNFASKLMARLLRRTIALNGAAFAIRRKALEELGGIPRSLTEDFDLGLQSFLRGHRFTFIEDTYVLNFAPGSWREWFKQRKRWAVGVADWLRRNYRAVFLTVVRAPHAILPGLLLLLPSLVTFTLTLAPYNYGTHKLLILLLLLLSSALSQLVPVVTALALNVQLIYLVTATPLMLALLAFTAWHIAASRSVGLRSLAPYYPLYLFVYQTLWLMILLAGFIRVFILGKTSVDDWVV